jgi:hypothetical protein
MAWGDSAKTAAEQAARDGLFVKLPAVGDSVTVVFLAEPIAYEDTYQGKKSHKTMFEVWDVSLKRRRVFDVNAKHTVKWWKEIGEVGIDYQYKIECAGIGFDTAYDLRAKAKGEVTSSLRAAIDATEALDLQGIIDKRKKRAAQGNPSDSENHPVEEGEDPNIPFVVLAALGSGLLASWLAVQPVLSALV